MGMYVGKKKVCSLKKQVVYVEKPEGEFYLKVLDFYGNEIDSKRLNNGDVYTLPTPPTDDKLIFQEWSSSQEIVDNQIVIDNNNVMIGAIGTPKSGLSEFDIELTKATGKTATCNMVGNKNWGDGTSDDLTTHEYADYGEYTITCDGTKLVSYMFGSGTQVTSPQNILKRVRFANIPLSNYDMPSNVFGYCTNLESVTFSKSETTYYMGSRIFYYCRSLKSVIIPKNVTALQGYTCYYCGALRRVVIPYTCTQIWGGSNFAYCRALDNLSIPNAMASIASNVFDSMIGITEFVANYKADMSLSGWHALKKLFIGENIKKVGGSTLYSIEELVFHPNATWQGNFNSCESLKRVKMPAAVTTLGQTFANCYALKLVDFTETTVVPNLTSTSFADGSSALLKIVVPDSLYDEWIVATNWSAKADYIYKASEVNL